MAGPAGIASLHSLRTRVTSGPSTVEGPPTQSRIAHNTLLNLVGVAVPLAIAFLVMPVAARTLGPARFGLIALAWAVTEYLILFDLGLGRATVRFVADTLRRNATDVTQVASLAIAVQLIAGLAGGGLFALLAPTLVGTVFKLPPALAGEALAMFRVVGFGLPVVLLLTGLRGILEGAQRFDLSNGLKIASSSASVALPAVGGLAGASLSTIMWWIVISRLLFCGLSLVAIPRAVPLLKWRLPRRWSRSREMLSFGGWVLVSNAVSPVLTYFDRFALGAVAGVAAVGFYTAPYEGVTRLGLIAVALGSSILPALSSLKNEERAWSAGLVSSSIRTVTVLMILPLAVIFVFAPTLLEMWLDPTTAAQAGTALRILSIGVFANALAQIPLVTLYAYNRPDLPAKFHLGELVVHVPLTLLLVSHLGIAGAALAWTIRVWIDLFLLLAGASRCLGVSVTVMLTTEKSALARIWQYGRGVFR